MNEVRATQSAHIRFLDGTRGLAALFVAAHHAYQHACGRAWTPPWYLHWLEGGHLAVGVFIVLSGFLLVAPIVRSGNRLQHGVKGFFVRRARRILPTYYLALGSAYALWMVGLGGIGAEPAAPITLANVLAHLTLTHNFLGDSAPNSALWSVALESQIYLFVPLLAWTARRITLPLACLALALFGHEIPKFGIDVFCYWYLALFAAGGMAAWVIYGAGAVAEGMRRRVPWRTASVALLGGLAAFLCKYGIFQRMQYLDYLIGLTAATCIVATALRPDGAANRMLSRPVPSGLGLFSYSFYLLHVPILQAFQVLILNRVNLGFWPRFLLLETVGLALCIGLSYAFFLVAERPFLSTSKPKTGLPAAPVGEPAALTSVGS